MDSPDEVINLNVGGCFYTTSRSTLTRFPKSMLGSMFSGRLPSKVDDCDRFIIDGDGPTFRRILKFLRRSKLILPDGFTEWDILKAKADFYQIQDLIHLIMIEEKKARPKHKTSFDFLMVTYRYNGPGGPRWAYDDDDYGRPGPWSVIGMAEIIIEIPLVQRYFADYSVPFYFSKGEMGEVLDIPEACNIDCLQKDITKIGFTLISAPTCSDFSSDKYKYIWTFSRACHLS